MSSIWGRSVLLFLPLVMSLMFGNLPRTANAQQLLVFISAFKPGDEGAIHAFRLDVAGRRLAPLHRQADVEHPFFLALSPGNKYLYSIHAPGQFGGKNDEQVAAYELVGDSGQLR